MTSDNHAPVPYIGITGFTSREEILPLLRSVPANRRLMAGVLASSRTLRGEDNGRLTRYPAARRIADIFIADERVLNILHFNSKEADLMREVAAAMQFAGDACDGIQLNIAWPSPHVLKFFRSRYESKQMILQVGAKAFSQVANSPDLLVDTIQRRYAGLIDYLLLDPSGGEGQPMDGEVLSRYVEAMVKRGLSDRVGISVAGGLSAATIDLLDPIRPYFHLLSIDAEGRLRTPKPEDALCLQSARDYLEVAAGFLGDAR